jgi:catechol 2,3-dioxygenase-like lactoylglutathione lyase family enzyme
MLAVRDVDASASWYARVLGCGVERAAADFARLVDGAQVLALLHCHDAREHGPLRGEGAAGDGFVLWIETDDLDGVRRRALEAGADIVVDLHANDEDDARELMLRDPDGFRVAITGR